jgi:hypothetical protein
MGGNSQCSEELGSGIEIRLESEDKEVAKDDVHLSLKEVKEDVLFVEISVRLTTSNEGSIFYEIN